MRAKQTIRWWVDLVVWESSSRRGDFALTLLFVSFSHSCDHQVLPNAAGEIKQKVNINIKEKQQFTTHPENRSWTL